MKKFYTLLAAAATTVAAMAWEAPNPMIETLYLIGDPCSPAKAEVPENAVIGNPATGWYPSNGIPMTKTAEGVFEVSIKITAASWFAFNSTIVPNATDANWDTWNAARYTPAAGGDAQEGAQPMKVGCDPKPDSWAITPGDYKFTVDVNTGILTVGGNIVREIGDVYLRGTFNNWLNDGTDPAYLFTKVNDEVYTLDVAEIGAYSVEGEGEAATEINAFKIANMSWTAKWTSGLNDMKIGKAEYFDDSSEANMGLKEGGKNLTITLNLADETILIAEKSAGIAGVEVEEAAEAVYYNLQGVRVANPENGLFIEVKGGKAAKVIR